MVTDLYPRGNEIGPFRAIEESTIAHLTSKEDRSDVYAWYSLIGTAGTALGFAGCGWIITFLQDQKKFSSVQSYRIIFFIYAAVGIIKLCLALLLSKACELDPKPKPKPISNSASSASETAPLLGNGSASRNKIDEEENAGKKRRWRLLPDVSKESQIVLVQLCILFAFDNFASGLAPL